MLSGTAITSAIAEETSVPKMNGQAPNCSVTGSQLERVTKLQPNLRNARWDPLANSQPMMTIKANTVSAINSVSHLKTRSPIGRLPAPSRDRFETVADAFMLNKRTKGVEDHALRPAVTGTNQKRSQYFMVLMRSTTRVCTASGSGA